MEEKELRTSTKTRVLIGIVAVVLLGSIIAGYAAVILNKGESSGEQQISPEKVAEYQQEYDEKKAVFEEASKADFEKFIPYKSEVVAYNEAAANGGDVVTQDLVVGEGRELTDGDTDYLAYYIGWCPDESILDSTLNDNTNPTAFKTALDVSESGSMIEGWQNGVIGMKLGGIREITIPAELAYKDQEVCGGTYKPLKFLVMAVANEGALKTAVADLSLADTKLQYANLGVDYDETMEEIMEEDVADDGSDGEVTEEDSEVTQEGFETAEGESETSEE